MIKSATRMILVSSIVLVGAVQANEAFAVGHADEMKRTELMQQDRRTAKQTNHFERRAGTIAESQVVHHKRYRERHYSDDYGGRQHYRGHERYRGYGHRDKQCHPRRAIRKAWRMGLSYPEITRMKRDRIVVRGWEYGRKTKVVFDRWSRRCHVIKVRHKGWH